VVFDAPRSARGVPKRSTHKGLTVHFAVDRESADELIEELIRADSAPRKLTVVSSDHRVQRAARRRRATAVDSDQWHAALVRGRMARETPGEPSAKPSGALAPHEVAFWLKVFGISTAEAADRAGTDVPPSKR
jgi:predicted RNA-binding protein with PIN domain